MASFIPSSPHLQEALASIHQASLDFSNPDPQVRSSGEATFLALRQSDGALDYACFALQHSQDPVVLFQSLNAILHVLPHLSADSPSATIPSLTHLRDFVLNFCVSKGQQAAKADTATSTQWPQYLRARANKAAIAVEKRVLGLQLSQLAKSNSTHGLEAIVQSHVELLNNQLNDLLQFPTPWPTDPAQSALVSARILSGLGLVKSVVDEFVLTAASESLAASQVSSSERKAATSKTKLAESGSAVGLSVVKHRWCKAIVQALILPTIMASSFKLLYNLVSLPSATAEAHLSTFSQAVSAIEKLLGWSFIFSDPFTSFVSSQQSENAAIAAAVEEELYQDSWIDDSANSRRLFHARKVPEQFTNLLLSDDIISLLASAYRFGISTSLTNKNAQVTFSIHRLRMCLLLAASFTPDPNPSKDAAFNILIRKTKHLVITLQSLVQEACMASSVSTLSVQGNSLLFLAQAYQILLHTTPLQVLSSALQQEPSDASGIIAFLSSLANLGSLIFNLAFQRPTDLDEEDDLIALAEDTTDTLLSCWLALIGSLRSAQLDSAQSEKFQMLSQAVYGSVRDQVFVPYVKGRLQSAANPNSADMDEQDEATAKDREVFSDQLIMIANLGRLSAAQNLGFLHQLAQPLCERLSAVAQGQMALEPSDLESTWEQIHWLLLIAGHLLADEAKGETPEIPSEIASNQDPQEPAVTLIVQLGLELLHKLSVHGPASLKATSPQVTETLLWFTGRWTSSYLLIDNHSGFPTNAAIQQAFSGEAGRSVLSFLLQRLGENLQLWNSDADVLSQIANVLSSFTRSTGIMIHLLQLPEMESLVSLIVSGLEHFPASTHGVLVSTVVSCIYSGAIHVGPSTTFRTPESYFNQITSSIETRFQTLLGRPDFASNSQRSDIILGVQTCLDMLEGLAISVQPNSVETIYSFIAKFFKGFPQLASVYEGRPEVAISLIRVLHTLSVSLELDFGAEPYMVTGLNQVTFETLTALQGASSEGRKKTHTLMINDGLEDAKPYEGICLTIELLNELAGAARSGIDDSVIRPPPSLLASPSLDASLTCDVCLFGFDQVIQLFDPPTPLSVPRVRRGFGQLVSNLVTSFSTRLIHLSFDLLDRTTNALILCLSIDEPEIVITVCESIPFLCHSFTTTHSISTLSNSSILLQPLIRLTQSVFSHLLLQPIDSCVILVLLFSLYSLVQLLDCSVSRLHELVVSDSSSCHSSLSNLDIFKVYSETIQLVVQDSTALTSQEFLKKWKSEITNRRRRILIR